jgi:putative membrane protein
MIQYDPHCWLDHLFDVKGSLIPEITLRVLSCFAWSVGVVAFDRYVGDVSIPATVHTLVGVALGMLRWPPRPGRGRSIDLGFN